MMHKTGFMYEQHEPAYVYHVLRSAVEKYAKGVFELTDNELALVCKRADKSYALESKVLTSDEARGVVVQQEQVERALQELAARYPDYNAFLEDLNANGLNEDDLHHALSRELLFDAIMKKVASRSVPISDIDVQLFYQLHRERFSSPETRHARHLLITINPDYADNQRDNARARIDDLHRQLQDEPASFEELVLRHSECPTAMQGGVLGKLSRGRLYPELDEALFAMQENQISDVVESELGFHILLCEKIEPARSVPLNEVEHKIRFLLEERQQRHCQKAWLAKLKE